MVEGVLRRSPVRAIGRAAAALALLGLVALASTSRIGRGSGAAPSLLAFVAFAIVGVTAAGLALSGLLTGGYALGTGNPRRTQADHRAAGDFGTSVGRTARRRPP